MSIILLTSLFIMLASLAGKLATFSIAREFIQTNFSLLISLAVGVFGSATYFLIIEVQEIIGVYNALFWLIIGSLVVATLARFIPEYHHHHLKQEVGHQHSRRSAYRILFSDGIHNVADGILITTSFFTAGVIGFGVAISIFIHELIQEITEFFVLKQAGYSDKQALIRNFLVSTTILLGSVGSYYFLQIFKDLEGPLLGLAAGGLLLALLQDLIPSSFESIRTTKRLFPHLIAVIAGGLFIFVANYFLGHGI